jgi:hypothetical protein
MLNGISHAKAKKAISQLKNQNVALNFSNKKQICVDEFRRAQLAQH